MEQFAFSRFHPAVNFIFFIGAIGFGVVLQHPMYLLAGLVCSGLCYWMLEGRRAWRLMLGMVPMVVLVALINPIVNTRGDTVLLRLFDRPYTLEALCYGAALGVMFAVMMLWFGCYNLVLTSDKFICLFGSLIPSLSLLLVMVLRLIPSFMRKTRQITTARAAIGKGGGSGSFREKAAAGVTILSALTDWALEGSIVTADSMRSRGYGSAKRTSYRIYRMTTYDWIALAVEGLLALGVLLGGSGTAEFTPVIVIPKLSWGFAAYWGFLLIPVIIQWKENLQWRYLRSKL